MRQPLQITHPMPDDAFFDRLGWVVVAIFGAAIIFALWVMMMSGGSRGE